MHQSESIQNSWATRLFYLTLNFNQQRTHKVHPKTQVKFIRFLPPNKTVIMGDKSITSATEIAHQTPHEQAIRIYGFRGKEFVYVGSLSKLNLSGDYVFDLSEASYEYFIFRGKNLKGTILFYMMEIETPKIEEIVSEFDFSMKNIDFELLRKI